MKITNLKINYRKILSILAAFNIMLTPSISKSLSQEAAINEVIDDMSFDDMLSSSGVISQKDELWKNWPYKKSTHPEATFGSAGCEAASIANALIIAFNIQDKDVIELLLKNIISTGSDVGITTSYIIENRQDRRYPTLNELISNIDGEVIKGGGNIKTITESIRNSYDGENKYIFGRMLFGNDYNEIINMINLVYQKNPDTNIILYGMTGGHLSLERPFGSISSTGHYLTLLINAKEFVENNTIYLLDSNPRNLEGEETYKYNYNFILEPDTGKLKKFNDTYIITRINGNILKIVDREDFIDSEALDLLGLEGGCGVIICPNNLEIKLDKQHKNK